MGVPGLLDAFKPASRRVNLTELSGLTLAVDGYGWLHRAAVSSAADLLNKAPTTKFLDYIDRRVTMFNACNISLYFVFDGEDLPLKTRINANRGAARQEALAKFRSLGSCNDKLAKKALDITPELAACVCAYLKARKIPFVVAPNEADAQMVWLEREGIVDGILSEDSDLLVFGAKKLYTKLEDTQVIMVDSCGMSTLPLFRGHGSFSLQELRTLAIISGCDYSPGIPGIGVVKAAKYLSQYKDFDRIALFLKSKGHECDSAFAAIYRQADTCFQYQRVWDTKNRTLVTLNPDCPPDASEDVIGKELAKEISLRVAYSVLHPKTHERLLVPPHVSCYVSKVRAVSKPAVRSCTDIAARQRASKMSSIDSSDPGLVSSPFFKRSASMPNSSTTNLPSRSQSEDANRTSSISPGLHSTQNVLANKENRTMVGKRTHDELETERSPLSEKGTNSSVVNRSKHQQGLVEHTGKKVQCRLINFKEFAYSGRFT